MSSLIAGSRHQHIISACYMQALVSMLVGFSLHSYRGVRDLAISTVEGMLKQHPCLALPILPLAYAALAKLPIPVSYMSAVLPACFQCMFLHCQVHKGSQASTKTRIVDPSTGTALEAVNQLQAAGNNSWLGAWVGGCLLHAVACAAYRLCDQAGMCCKHCMILCRKSNLKPGRICLTASCRSCALLPRPSLPLSRADSSQQVVIQVWHCTNVGLWIVKPKGGLIGM